MRYGLLGACFAPAALITASFRSDGGASLATFTQLQVPFLCLVHCHVVSTVSSSAFVQQVLAFTPFPPGVQLTCISARDRDPHKLQTAATSKTGTTILRFLFSMFFSIDDSL